jgi:hypothetical protein
VDTLGNLRFSFDGVLLQLSGVLDETVRLTDLVPRLGQQITIDLGEVKRINSIGVLAWLRFMRQMNGRKVMLRRCPPAVVEQMSMILGFRGSARVESVLAPYVCPKCHADRFEVIAAKEAAQGRAPARTCGNCGGPTRLDDDEPERWLAPFQG